MPHLLFFRLQVELGVLGDLGFAGNAFDDFDPRVLQGSDLVRIIGKQTHLRDIERLQHFSGQGVLAEIGFEPKPFVGFDCVEPLVLQFVGLQFRHQPNAAAFLLFVYQDAGASLRDQRKRHLELGAAIAAQRTEYVSGEALRVNAHKRWGRMDVAHDEGDRGLFAALAARFKMSFKAEDAEVSPTCREIGLSDFLHNFRRSHISIISGRCADRT